MSDYYTDENLVFIDEHGVCACEACWDSVSHEFEVTTFEIVDARYLDPGVHCELCETPVN